MGTKNLQYRGRKWKLLVLLGILLLSFVPFPTTIVPEWHVRFVDEAGAPVPGVSARISCYHYSYSNKNRCPDDEGRTSNANGEVVFPGQSIWLGLLPRIFLTAVGYALLLAHGSVGIDAYLVVSTPQGYEGIPGVVEFTNAQQIVRLKREQ